MENRIDSIDTLRTLTGTPVRVPPVRAVMQRADTVARRALFVGAAL